MGGLFSSKSSSTNTTTNTTDSFNKSVSSVFAPTSGAQNITVNVGNGQTATGNAYVDGLSKIMPIIAIALIGWAFIKN